MPDHKAPEKPTTAAAEASPPPVVDFTPAKELVERVTHPETPRCTECGKALTAYSGGNPHKRASLECLACQRRYWPEDVA